MQQRDRGAMNTFCRFQWLESKADEGWEICGRHFVPDSREYAEGSGLQPSRYGKS